IRADALGVIAETYENQRVPDPEIEHSVIEIDVAGAEVDAFFQQGSVPAMSDSRLFANAGVMLRDVGAPNHTALGRYDAHKGQITTLRVPRDGIMGVRPRNKEQAFALDLLLDDNVRLVTLIG